jgi:diketogulonate reductase-like aldo/keto reductase
MGLSKVIVVQFVVAGRIAEISAVQVELSVWHDENLLNGVVQYCAEHSIKLIAYRPLGGSRRVRQMRHHPMLRELAEQHAATPAEIALAWINALSPQIVSIPGATTLESIMSIVRAHTISLSVDDRERLAARFDGRGGSSDPPALGGSKDASTDSNTRR